MKKTINTLGIGVIVLAVLYSCQKEPQNVAVPQSNSASLISEFKSKIASATIEENDNSSMENARSQNSYPAFPVNPYNNVGFYHNEYADIWTANQNYLTKNLDGFLGDVNSTLVKNKAIKIDAKSIYNSSIIVAQKHFMTVNAEIKFDPNSINSLPANQITKDLVLAFILDMEQTSNAHLRIAKTKVAEIFVNGTNEEIFGGREAKVTLLSFFAIYRYSTSYWNFENNGSATMRPLGALMDAITAWYMENYVSDPWAIPDAETVGQVSSFVSAAFDAFGALWGI